MELACNLKFMSVKAAVERTPRETNREADSLANGHTEQFKSYLRVQIDWTQFHWNILPHAVSVGRQAEQAALSAKPECAYPGWSTTAEATKARTQASCDGPLVKEQGFQNQHPRIQITRSPAR